MPVIRRLARPKRPNGSAVAAALVVVLFAVSVAIVATGLFIQLKLKPVDGRFGVPQYLVFPLCGRDYMLSSSPYTTETRIDRDISSDARPDILQPTIGMIPLTDLFTRCPMHDGFYYTVIWLRVGPDSYATYSLEGGP